MKQIYIFITIFLLSFANNIFAQFPQNLEDIKSWNKYYYANGQTFSFTTASHITKVKVNGSEIIPSSQEFSTSLIAGTNTIETYKEETFVLQGIPRVRIVLDKTYTLEAKLLSFSINDGNVINSGDEVTILFNQLDLPLVKTNGVYNPRTAYSYYNTNISELAKIESEHGTSKLNTIKFTIPSDAQDGDEYTLSGGHIYEQWWGDKLWAGNPVVNLGGFMGEVNYYDFDFLPNITITVGEQNTSGESDVVSITNPVEDITVNKNAQSSTIDLSSVFESTQSLDIEYSVLSNTNSDLVSTTIKNSELQLNYTLNESGNATIAIKAQTSNGGSATDEIFVTVENVNEEPILNINYADFGYSETEVPDDWKNDLWLNSDYKCMTIGEEYDIVARRVPEIIDNPISNNVVLPNFTYTIVSGNSIRVDNNGKVTALRVGPTVIEVYYKAVNAYNKDYAACSPINKTYMVVDVVENSASDMSITTNIEKVKNTYHTYYFTEDYYKYSFTASASNSNKLEVLCNGETAIFDGTEYTVNLKNRANIIEIKACSETDTLKNFFVVDGRKIEINIANQTNPDNDFELGDKARISFKGLVIPVYKLATIYNPYRNFGFGGSGDNTRVYYTNSQLGDVKSNINITQYDLADNNTIELTLNDYGKYTFTGGHVNMQWWGSELGAEKAQSGPGAPNLGALELQADLSFLPDFTIEVKTPYSPALFEDIAMETETEKYADATSSELYTPVNETYNSGSYSFSNSATNWGSGVTSWNGVALSNRTDKTTLGDVNNQFNSAAGGDINGDGNYTIVFDGKSVGGMGNSSPIEFTNTANAEGRVVSGCYVTNNTYATNSMKNGDSFAKKFGGEDGNDPDFFVLTVTGIDADGEITSSKDFYLADYRSEDNRLDYIVEDWKWIDLSSLGKISKIQFSVTSSDVGDYGMNTPAYYCIDNIDKQVIDLGTSLEDISANENAPNLDIDLSNLFVNLENADSEIEKSISINTNDDAVLPTITGNNLSLDFKAGGVSMLVIKGKYKGISITDTINISVTALPPVVANAIEDVTVDEDAPVKTISIANVFTDPDSDDALIVKTVNSNSNDELVTATINEDELVLSFISNANGTAEITIEGESNGLTATSTFTVTVNPIDDVPVVANAIEDITVDEDAPVKTISIANLFTDIDNTVIAKSISSNSNNALVDATVNGDNIVLSFTSNSNGTTEITIEGEANEKTISSSFKVTVTPVDDAPIVANPVEDVTVDEDASVKTISIANLFTDPDNDEVSIIKTIDSNSNDELVAATINGDELVLSFISNANGTAEIAIKGKSNGLTTSSTFTVTVNPIDDAPVVTNAIEDITVSANSSNSVISLTNVFTDIDNDDSAITKSVASNSNTDLVSTTISGDELTLSFIADKSGEAEIVIEGLSNGVTVSNTFKVIVLPVSGVEYFSINNITLYPNPSNGIFKIKTNWKTSSEINIYNMYGVMVYSNKSFFNKNEIDISNQPSGQYVIILKQGNNIITKKMIKE